MSKSAQPAAKADVGGQRTPKGDTERDSERGSSDKKTSQSSTPAKKTEGKKTGG